MSSFQKMVDEDLERACRLVKRVHPDPIDPQIRFASPAGDYWLAMTIEETSKGQRKAFEMIAKLLAYEQSAAFTMATEIYEPDAVVCIGSSVSGDHMGLKLIQREPLKFGAMRWYPSEAIDPEVKRLLPSGATTVSEDDLTELEA